MKATKWIVGGAALVGISSTFMDWMSIELGGLAKSVADDVPTGGMDNGGPIFIFLLGLPLLAAIIGIAKRFGRGMGVMALIGGLLATFLALVKYADISEAAAQLASAGMGQASVAVGYWVLFVGSTLATLGGLFALIKPEPAPTLAAQR
jgi:hypothetical protein